MPEAATPDDLTIITVAGAARGLMARLYSPKLKALNVAAIDHLIADVRAGGVTNAEFDEAVAAWKAAKVAAGL